MKKTVLGIAVAAAIFIVVMLLRDRTEATQAASASTAPGTMGKASSELVLSIAPGSKQESARAPGQSKVSPLMQEFIGSRDYKAIYDRLKALANPSGEDLYVMAQILESCAEVTDRKEPSARKWGDSLGDEKARARFAATLSPKAPNYAKRLAAFDAMNFNACAGIDVKVAEKDIRALHERAASAGDPKSRVAMLRYEFADQHKNPDGTVDWFKPVTVSDAQLETWKQVVSSGDPRAVMDAMSVLTSTNLGNLHLRGPDEAPIDGNSLYLASMLASCELGRDCSANALYLQQACALEGACDAANLRDYLLFYASPPSRSQLVVQYHDQLLRAIGGDWSFFAFVRSPAPGIAPFQRP